MKPSQIFLFAAALIATPALALDWTNPDSVVQTAIEANPSLAALSARIRAAQERVEPAGSLPNPMLMAGVLNRTVDLSHDFMTMRMVGVSQTVVLKSRRDILRRSAELDVEWLQRDFEARRAEIERDVRSAYIEAAAAQSQSAATEELARLLQSVTESSRIRYESGAVPQADMIRAILQRTSIDHQLLLLRRQRAVAITRLLPLLGLPQNTPVPPFVLERGMDRPHDAGIDATLPDTTPAIAELEADVARADQDLRLAKLATKPDFNIEASYGLRSPETDMFSIVARIELPIRRAAIIEPRIREAVARREAALQQIEALRLQLRQDLGTASMLRNEAIEELRLHFDKLMPIARLGFESSLASYQTGKTTFDAVLDALRTDIALNVDYYDFLRQQLEAEVDIQAILRGARVGGSRAGSMPSSPATLPALQSGSSMQ